MAPPPAAEPLGDDFFFWLGNLNVVEEAIQALCSAEPFPVMLEDALPTLELIDQIYATAQACAGSALLLRNDCKPL